MVDKLTPEARSANMAEVRGTDTGPELAVRRIAHRMGLRFRLYRKDLPGKPDLVFPKHRLVVFVHGCFWHRHEGCRRCTTPVTRAKFWEQKFEATQERDARQRKLLHAGGWKVLTLWECEVKDAEFVESQLSRSLV